MMSRTFNIAEAALVIGQFAVGFGLVLVFTEQTADGGTFRLDAPTLGKALFAGLLMSLTPLLLFASQGLIGEPTDGTYAARDNTH
jgi:hypothetical protein